jgi:hypothetical protein
MSSRLNLGSNAFSSINHRSSAQASGAELTTRLQDWRRLSQSCGLSNYFPNSSPVERLAEPIEIFS